MSSKAVYEALLASFETCRVHEAELGQLDSAAGDGDHGSGMVRGFTAACSAAVDLRGSVPASIAAAAQSFADAAGGASGALWGAFLQTVADSIGDEDIAPGRVVTALREGEAAPGAAREGPAWGQDPLGHARPVSRLARR